MCAMKQDDACVALCDLILSHLKDRFPKVYFSASLFAYQKGFSSGIEVFMDGEPVGWIEENHWLSNIWHEKQDRLVHMTNPKFVDCVTKACLNMSGSESEWWYF